MSETELPIGRLVKRIAPNIHDSIFDPYGRFAPFWKWSMPKEEEEKSEEVRLHEEEVTPRHPALAGIRDIAVDLGLIEIYEPPPKVYAPIPPEEKLVIMPALPPPRPIISTSS